MLRLLHRIDREARAGRLCHVMPIVPSTNSTRCSVMTRHGGSVRMIQMGSIASSLRNMEVNAGLVVADVAVVCVLRNSVNLRKGSSSTSHRWVNISSVSRISSKLFRFSDSESALLRFFFSPLQVVLESGLYLLPYMPAISTNSTTTGPAYLVTWSVYSTVNQKPATSKKLSQGSPVVHDSSPARWLRGSMKGCEYANTLVTWGGVAASNGLF